MAFLRIASLGFMRSNRKKTRAANLKDKIVISLNLVENNAHACILRYLILLQFSSNTEETPCGPIASSILNTGEDD